MQNQIKIDLHTHSILSHDGGITNQQYRHLLQSGSLDYIAVTDHNEVEFAQALHAELGDKVIIGEEIKAAEGEVIGLYLTDKVPKGLSLGESINRIKSQGGLVYIPHPFDIRRSGVPESVLTPLLSEIDIIEVFNPRNITPGGNSRALQFARKHNLSQAASSDAHCQGEAGHSYSIATAAPTAKTLKHLLESATVITRYTRPWHLLCPKYNKLKKLVGRTV